MPSFSDDENRYISPGSEEEQLVLGAMGATLGTGVGGDAHRAPTPSREELDKVWDTHDHRYRSAEEWKEAMKTALMAWASGQPMTPRWCVHCRQEIGSWWQHYPNGGARLLTSSDAVCSICAAPRPKETE